MLERLLLKIIHSHKIIKNEDNELKPLYVYDESSFLSSLPIPP